MKFFKNDIWFGNDVRAVAVNEKTKEILFKYSKLENDEKYVNWKTVNGFINLMFVFIIADENIFVYVDPYEGDYGRLELIYTYEILDYNTFFWCSKEVPSVIISPIESFAEDGNSKNCYINKLFPYK